LAERQKNNQTKTMVLVHDDLFSHKTSHYRVSFGDSPIIQEHRFNTINEPSLQAEYETETKTQKETRTIVEDTSASYFKHLWEMSQRKVMDLELLLEKEREQNRNLKRTIQELEARLSLVPHPFHNFSTLLDEDEENEEGVVYDTDSDQMQERDQQSSTYDLEAIPESPIAQPPLKKRKFDILQFVATKSLKTKPKRSTEQKPPIQLDTNDNTHEIPDDTGSVDTSLFVNWEGHTYALSKAFPTKHKLMKTLAKYQELYNRSANLIIENDDLRILKQLNKNVGAHSRTIALYTMHFVRFFVSNENEE
jgi:hypothetical protein